MGRVVILDKGLLLYLIFLLVPRGLFVMSWTSRKFNFSAESCAPHVPLSSQLGLL